MAAGASEASAWSSKAKWGPMFWELGHLVSFAYPESAPSAEQREQTARFFESLSSVVPCEECQHDFAELLGKYPVREHLSCRESVSRWFYDMHNKVNQKLGKPIVLSYEDVKQQYLACATKSKEIQACKKTSSNQKIIIGAMAVILIGLLVVIFATRKSK